MIYDGIITSVLPKETISTGGGDKEKVTFVMEENRDTEYKGSIVVDLRGDKVSMLEPFKVGSAVKVSLNSRAREYNGRRYNSITARRVEPSEEGGDDMPPMGAANGEAKADLPF